MQLQAGKETEREEGLRRPDTGNAEDLETAGFIPIISLTKARREWV